MTDKTRLSLSAAQYHLADALGLSVVHVNRVLRHLRDDGPVTFRKGHVIFNDIDRLREMMAGFDTAYLDQDGPLLR
ncbi:helix-turn-helix domain-containing protein [Roseovarius autotrophicus]|uniref:helix-turn-helix domain-containing protein n=1 Tax=Roseovarius autotrophicus TaxID=2824121 RepID=UPI00300D5AF0